MILRRKRDYASIINHCISMKDKLYNLQMYINIFYLLHAGLKISVIMKTIGFLEQIF